jgi:hypothetical protein
LKEFMSMNDNQSPMQKGGRYQGVDLGKWCGRMREKKRRGEMPLEQQEEFEAIPGWWWEVRGGGVRGGELCKKATSSSFYLIHGFIYTGLHLLA